MLAIMWIMAWRRANTDPEEGAVTVTKVAATVAGTRLGCANSRGGTAMHLGSQG